LFASSWYIFLTVTVDLYVWHVSKTVMHKAVLSTWNVPYKPLLTQFWRCGPYNTLPLLRHPIYWTVNVPELARVNTNSDDCVIDDVQAQRSGTKFVVVMW